MKYVSFVFFFLLSVVSGGLFDAPVGCVMFDNIRLGICSGRGKCVLLDSNNTQTIIHEPHIPNSQCICDSGWTGSNDFVNMKSHDCGQNIATINTLWSLTFIGAFFESIYLIYRLYQSWLAYKEHHFNSELNTMHTIATTNSEDLHEHDHHNNTTNNHSNLPNISSPSKENHHLTPPILLLPTLKIIIKWPVVYSSLTALFSAIFLMMASMDRFSDSGHVIGVSPLTSFCYCVAESLFSYADRAISFSWLSVRGKILRFTSKNEEEAKKAILRLKRAMRFGFFFDFTRILAVLLIHVVPEQASAWTLIYEMSIASNMVLSGVHIVVAGRALEAILVDGIESLNGTAKEEREKVLTNIRNIINTQKNSLALPIILNFLTGWWPFLRSHLSYNAWQLLLPPFLVPLHLAGLQPPKLHQSRKETTAQSTGHHHHHQHLEKHKSTLNLPKEDRKETTNKHEGEAEEEREKLVVRIEDSSPISDLRQPQNFPSPSPDRAATIDSSAHPLTPSTSDPNLPIINDSDLSSSMTHTNPRNTNEKPIFNPFS